MKINFFKKENSFKKKDFTSRPNFYWKIVLFSTAIMILLSFVFSYHLFGQINQEPVLSFTNEDGKLGTINKDRILKVLNYFSEREKNSVEILNSPAPVVDPSL